jgi:large subunit ribosomal protein L3
VVQVAPCRVVQIKTPDSEGYSALQVTFGNKDLASSTTASRHFEKAGVAPGTKLVELRIDDVSTYSVGQEITVDILQPGDFIDVTGVSRGKGFTGAMKRHGFKGQGALARQSQEAPLAGFGRAVRDPSRVFAVCVWPGARVATR